MSEDKQRSTAGGVFWGLVLFFVVLPIGLFLSCGLAMVVGTAVAP